MLRTGVERQKMLAFQPTFLMHSLYQKTVLQNIFVFLLKEIRKGKFREIPLHPTLSIRRL